MADEGRQSATLSGHQEALDFAHRCHQEAIKRVIRHVHVVQHHVGSLREEPQGGHLWGEDAVVSACMLGWYLREEPQGGHLWGEGAVVSACMLGWYLREEPQGGHLWGARRRGEHLHAGVVSSSVHERRARRAQGELKASSHAPRTRAPNRCRR